MRSVTVPDYPQYGITSPTLNPFFPMNCPEHSGYATLRLLQDIRHLNQVLREQLIVMHESAHNLESCQ